MELHGATVYDNICQVEPGQYIKIHMADNRVEKAIYWKPLKDSKKIKLQTDEEYRALFLSTFRKAVDGFLHTSGEVGIMLSGGLDSSSVAAAAASKFGEEGRKLYSYTAVPADDYCYTNSLLSKRRRLYGFPETAAEFWLHAVSISAYGIL